MEEMGSGENIENSNYESEGKFPGEEDSQKMSQ